MQNDKSSRNDKFFKELYEIFWNHIRPMKYNNSALHKEKQLN